MSTNPLISQLIEEKKAARYLKFLHMGIFFLTALYVFLYEIVLVEIPAINHELYAIGKIMDGVADTPEKMDRYVKTIYNKTNEMDHLINELTFYSKIDTNRISARIAV